MSDHPLATVELTVHKGDTAGSIRLVQAGSGSVLLRFEALILAATQLLRTAMAQATEQPDGIDDAFVARTLAEYITGDLTELAETMVMTSLQALTPETPTPAEE